MLPPVVPLRSLSGSDALAIAWHRAPVPRLGPVPEPLPVARRSDPGVAFCDRCAGMGTWGRACLFCGNPVGAAGPHARHVPDDAVAAPVLAAGPRPISGGSYDRTFNPDTGQLRSLTPREEFRRDGNLVAAALQHGRWPFVEPVPPGYQPEELRGSDLDASYVKVWDDGTEMR